MSRPSPSVLGRRPIETSTASASIVEASPPLAGSTVSVALPPLTVAPVTLVPVLMSKPCFLKILAAFLAHFLVHAGQDLVEIFDHGDLGAEPQPHAAKLEPDHAAADDDHMLGHLGQRQRAGRIDDHAGVIVDVDARAAA